MAFAALAAVAAAAAQGGASLIGSGLDYRSDKDQQNLLEDQREEDIALIQRYGQRAIDGLSGGYQNAQRTRKAALDKNMGLTGQTFRPMIDTMQSGDYMAQQEIISGLQGQRNALLGNPVNYGAMTPRNVPIDYSALTGLTGPESLEFSQIELPEYGASTNTQAQENWTDFNAQQYLAANPDIEPDYNRLRPQLLEGGDPQFVTLQGYAKWHYDNYGRQSGRPTSVETQQTQGAQQTQGTQINRNPAIFTAEQVRLAIEGMG